MIYILNTGVGNFKSIKNMLSKIGANSKIVDNDNEIKNPKLIIIPGVGHFKQTINYLKSNYDIHHLSNFVLDQKIPTLGICVGMQILGSYSEEGDCKGLNWLNFSVKKFSSEDVKTIPHMGWNITDPQKKKIYFLNESKCRFYFVHSYYCDIKSDQQILTTTKYDSKNFVSALQYENITGVQFHPEKSHLYGEYFFKKYIETL